MAILRKVVTGAYVVGVLVAGLWMMVGIHPYGCLSFQIGSKTVFEANRQSFGILHRSERTLVSAASLPPAGATVPYDEWWAICRSGGPGGAFGFVFTSRVESAHKYWEATQTRVVERRMHFMLLPFWICIPLVMGLPVLTFVGGRRRIAGMCAQCGYDLRAHGPDGRCPECGTQIECAVKS